MQWILSTKFQLNPLLKISLSPEVLIDELRPVVAGEKSIWTKTYVNIDGLSPNVLTVGIATQETKPPIFPGITLLEL